MNYAIASKYLAVVGGDVVWIKTRGKAKAGALFGADNGSGYRQGQFMGKHIYAHRMAWLLANGEMPSGEIDHINGNPLDNRIENLRVVTRQENATNIHSTRSDNKLGVMGVQRHRNKYRTRIRLGDRIVRVGGFDTPEEAHAAYIALKVKIHPAFSGGTK